MKIWNNFYIGIEHELELGEEYTTPSFDILSSDCWKSFAAQLSDIKIEDDYIIAQKSVWSHSGASLKDRREKKANDKEEAPANPWAQKSVNDAEMINEDDLLEEEAKTGGAKVFAKESDWLTKPKACENCTCGRKEQLENEELEAQRKKDLESGNIKSDCGKCYLGDAFRCATCPYLGQPAFEPGDKVKLKNVNQEENRTDVNTNTVKVSGTKVMLDL